MASKTVASKKKTKRSRAVEIGLATFKSVTLAFKMLVRTFFTFYSISFHPIFSLINFATDRFRRRQISAYTHENFSCHILITERKPNRRPCVPLLCVCTIHTRSSNNSPNSFELRSFAVLSFSYCYQFMVCP